MIKKLKNPKDKYDNFNHKYVEIMKNVFTVIPVDHKSSNLRQPSLLEEVDSITTCNCTINPQNQKY
ncbi:MAG: hypothetical protein ACYC6W_10840 [Nitrosotalea sp.]